MKKLILLCIAILLSALCHAQRLGQQESPIVERPPLTPEQQDALDAIREAAEREQTRVLMRDPSDGRIRLVDGQSIELDFKVVAGWQKQLLKVVYSLSSPSGRRLARQRICTSECGDAFEFRRRIDIGPPQNGVYKLKVTAGDSANQVVNTTVEFVLVESVPIPPVGDRGATPPPGYRLVRQADVMEPHPRLAPLPAIHFDHYNSSVSDAPIPEFSRLVVREEDFGGEFFNGTGACLNYMTDRRGNLVGFCGGLDRFVSATAKYSMTLLRKTDFDHIDEVEVADGLQLAEHGCEESSDDRAPLYLGYFVMDEHGRAIVTKDDNVAYFIGVSGDNRRLETADRIDFNRLRLPGMLRSFRLHPELNRVAQVIPDYTDGYWFMGQGTSRSSSFVGHIDARKRVDFFRWLNQVVGEEKIENGMAIDSTGVYVLSDHALYKFAMRNGTGRQVFRVTYERASPDRCKPGTFAHRGSGSTPTLLGDDLVAFTDNADGRVNVVVLDRRDVVPARGREICRVPVFEDGFSANENSLIGYRNSLIVQNWFGAPNTITGQGVDLLDGIWRIDVSDDRSSCEVVWENNSIGSTATARLSTKTGLIYFPVENWREEKLELAALDFETGREAAPRLQIGQIDFDDNRSGDESLLPDDDQIMMLPLYVLEHGELVQPVFEGVKRMDSGFR